MKTVVLFCFAVCSILSAAPVKVGEDVSFSAIASASVIQGEVPKDWKKDDLYVLVCWATWCGPCKKLIPHVNDLHNQLKDKGVTVIGINVMEDDLEKVTKFVEAKGDEMSYPVVFAGKDGGIDKDWLSNPDAVGIPRAFFVKNGKLLFQINPGLISADIIQHLLAGGAEEATAVKMINELAQQEKKLMEIMQDPKQKKMMAFQNDILTPLIRGKEFDKAQQATELFIKENEDFGDNEKVSLLLNAGLSRFVEALDKDGLSQFIDNLAAQYPGSALSAEAPKLKQSLNMQIEMIKRQKQQNGQ